MKYLIVIAASVVFASASARAQAVDLTKLPPPAAKEGVTYNTDIKPLFEASCTRCHGAREAKGGLRLDSLEAVLKGSKDRKVVATGSSAKSPLVIAISQLDSKLAMPPKPRPAGRRRMTAPGSPESPQQRPTEGPQPAKPLTDEEIGLVRAWIDQGAK
jgi:mono/diheme cytochrome c family protein